MKENNIIVACSFVAGIQSRGMENLKAEFADLTPKEIKKRDSFQFEPVYGYDFTYKRHRAGTRYEGETEGGEISLFDALEVP